MKYLLFPILLLFSANIYAKGYLCEILNETVVDTNDSQKHKSIKMVDMEVNNREIILYRKVEVHGQNKITKNILP